MYLRRKIDSYLLDWKLNDNRLPLLIKGCRQVGKTRSIMHFALSNYESVIEINFALEPKYKKITVDGYDVNSIIKNISRIDPTKKFIPGNTLIFFDEITYFPDIATSLKSFTIDGRFDVICSGALLGISYKRIESNSVGYKINYTMYSMDFEEFLWAKGYNCSVIDDMLNHLNELAPFNELEMNVFHNLFLDFSILGGMPAVVKNYIEKDTFEGSLDIQNLLIEGHKEDIRKYAEGLDQGRIMNVFNSIPSQLAKENKKFQLSKISHGARFKDYRGCIEWLKDSGIINVSYCLNFPELPLKGNVDNDKFKLYFSDSGLLVSLLDEEASEDLRVNQNLCVYKGALYENIVGESLVKSGYELFYYRKDDATLEIDFLLRNKDSLIPIEVKSNMGTGKSMRTIIESNKYEDVKFGIKLSYNNIGYENKVFTFPYFCTFLLKRFIPNFEFDKYIK